MNNEDINNDLSLYKCLIKFPDKCHIDILSSIMDHSKARNVDCAKDNPNIEQVENIWKQNYFNCINETLNDFKAIIYPKTNNNNFIFNKYDSIEKFYSSITKNIIFVNDTEKIDELEPEVILLKNEKNYEIKMNLQFNKKLSDDRNKLISEEDAQFPKNNIIFLYIDALSRPHFHRKMKYLSEFLSKFNSNKIPEYEVFQFMKYQSFKNEYYNSGIHTIFYEKMPKIRRQEQPNAHLITLLKNKGYITAQSANYCFKEFHSIQREYNFFSKTAIDEYDYENIAMFCDPFYRKQIPISTIKKCMYGKNSFEYVIDYGYEFWTKYPDNKKFLRLGFFEGNEKTGEVIKYLDYYLYKFLDDLYQNNYLENTIIFLVSGQGNPYKELFNSPFYFDYDFFIEKYLGTFFIFLDKKGLNLNEGDLTNLGNNEQNMVTPYDIHETIKSIAENKFYEEIKEIKEENENNNNNLGKSLFGYIYSFERYCKKYGQINRDICRCNDF